MFQIALYLLLAGFVFCQDSNPIVETLYGPVRGQRIATHYGIFVNSFYGIPYAADPIDDLRFEVRTVVSPALPHDVIMR